MPSPTSRNKTSTREAKNDAETDIKVSWSSSILLDFFTFKPATGGALQKSYFLENLKNSQENTLPESLF